MEVLQIAVAMWFFIMLAVGIAYGIHIVRVIYRLRQIEKGAKETTKYMKGYITTK